MSQIRILPRYCLDKQVSSQSGYVECPYSKHLRRTAHDNVRRTATQINSSAFIYGRLWNKAVPTYINHSRHLIPDGIHRHEGTLNGVKLYRRNKIELTDWLTDGQTDGHNGGRRVNIMSPSVTTDNELSSKLRSFIPWGNTWQRRRKPNNTI